MDLVARPASRTAVGVALLRAVHTSHDCMPRILHDDISPRLFAEAAIAHAAATSGPRTELRAHVLVRSRYAEERLRQAVMDRGVRQCVMLGAGLDTFAYRQPEWALSNMTCVIELDHPASQADKQRRLAEAGITVPANVYFASVDLATTALADALSSTCLDLSQPVFFFWLGVMVYLDASAIDQVFRCIVGLPQGSEVVFSFARPRADGRMSDAEARAAACGEPWLSKFEPDVLASLLQRHGFARVQFMSPEEGHAWFGVASDRTDGLCAPPLPSVGSATV